MNPFLKEEIGNEHSVNFAPNNRATLVEVTNDTALFMNGKWNKRFPLWIAGNIVWGV